MIAAAMMLAFQIPFDTRSVPTTTEFYLQVPHISGLYQWYGAPTLNDPPREFFLRHSPTSGQRAMFWSSAHVGTCISLYTELDTGNVRLVFLNGDGGRLAVYQSGSFSPFASSTWTRIKNNAVDQFPASLTLVPVP